MVFCKVFVPAYKINGYNRKNECMCVHIYVWEDRVVGYCPSQSYLIKTCIGSKLAQSDYKTRHGLLGKVIIHWELCKKLKLDHTNKWYMHNPESVLENKTQTPLRLSDTNGSPLSNRWPDLVTKKRKRTYRIIGFAVPADHWKKLKEKWKG